MLLKCVGILPRNRDIRLIVSTIYIAYLQNPLPIVLVHSYTATVMGKKIKILSSQLNYIFFTYKQRHFVYFVCYEVLR